MVGRDIKFYGSYNAFRPFILTVDSGADSKFTIPTFGTGYNYSLRVAGVVALNGLTGNYTINFPLANTDYIIEIYGLFPWWRQSYNSERLKVKDFIQFGDVVLTYFEEMFFGAENMIWSATDAPNVSGTGKSLYAFLTDCKNANPNFDNWDFSIFNSLNYAFNRNISINYNFNNLDVSNVISANSMLDGCTNQSYNIDWTDPIIGSISLVSFEAMIRNSGITSIKLQAGNLVPQSPVEAYYYITELILIDLKNSFWIIQYGLTGVYIDNLANSVADLTGFASKNVTMTLAQRASCNQSLWTAKNWTIIAI